MSAGAADAADTSGGCEFVGGGVAAGAVAITGGTRPGGMLLDDPAFFGGVRGVFDPGIRFASGRYSVPNRLIGSTVTVLLDEQARQLRVMEPVTGQVLAA